VSSRARNRRVAIGLCVAAVLAACATRAPVAQRRRPPRASERVDPSLASARIYERMGLIATAGAFPIVGRVAFLAAATPDSTLALVALSFPVRALTITAWQAAYDVTIDVTRQGRLVRHIDTTTTIRLDTVPAAERDAVDFQDALRLAPDDYQIALVVHDVASARTASRAVALTVPRLGAPPHGTLSSAIVVRAAGARVRLDTLPRLRQWPRAAAVTGRDSTVPVYIEGYGTDARCPMRLQARAIDGGILWRDSLTLVRTGALCAGLTLIPIARLGPGVTTLQITDPAGDTTTVPLFVTLDSDVSVAPYDQLLDDLRYFTTPATLAALRSAAPSTRGATWTAFLRRAGVDSLARYLRVLHQADARFPDEGIPGWQTPRGGVYLTLGDPEQIFLESASHRQIWDYQRYLTRLVFVDDSGTGHWRLTPHSAGDYDGLLKRLHR
jgi:GWxTD domain-containing protein